MMSEIGKILITGGTGSFGRSFVESLYQMQPEPRRVVIYSRDELKQYQMQQELGPRHGSSIRFFIGDVRDRDRLKRAMEGIQTVVHAAALKQVPAAEYNPFEAIRTNVLGAENVIEAALETGVQRVVALSTDKAAAPVNLYGATKLCADKLFIAANNMRGNRNIKFSVVRYGNVMGSRGSVIPLFLSQRNRGVLTVTDRRMTRFNITLDAGIGLVLHAIDHAQGGEIFIPRIPSYQIMDVAEAIAPGCQVNEIGIRPGEKLHEEMITLSDSPQTIANDRFFVIVPWLAGYDFATLMEQYQQHHSAQKVSDGFSYCSDQNPDRLSVAAIRELIRSHVDPSFVV